MKKLVVMMVGLGLMLGTVSMFGQEKKEEQKSESKKKGKKKKKDATPPPAV
jgi:hypothetical protein